MRTRSKSAQRVVSWACTIGAGFALACSESTPPLVPTTVVLSQQLTALDAIGASQPVSASVKDQHDAAMPNEVISWSSSSASVTIAAAPGGVATQPTSASSRANQAAITGASIVITAVSAGTAVVTATARTATATVTVQVSQVPTPPVKSVGDQQSGMVATTLLEPLRVRVQDRLGAPISGKTVTFTVTQGGGSVLPALATTGADGTAQTSWTLGNSTSTTHEVSASVPGAPNATTFSATARAGPPAAMTANGSNAQSATVGSEVAAPPSVLVSDAFGNPVPATSVAFTVTEGGGSVAAASAQTSANGLATPGSWTLGTVPGANSLTATAAGLAPVMFSATALTGPPAAIAVHAGDGQSERFALPLAVRPAVRVGDRFNNPVANVPITFAVTGGGGVITGATTTTDNAGVATVGSWTLGPATGPNSLTATATGPGITGNPVVFTAMAIGDFNITLRFLSTLTAAQTAAFNDAAARWRTLITNDLADLSVNIGGGQCGSNSTPINEVIDDVLIFVTIAAIDGPGAVLGAAGPCFVRTSGNLTVIGQMRFDIADVPNLETNGTLSAVVLHEMGHVLGIGTLWPTFGLLQNSSPVGGPPRDTHFSGTNAIAGFNAIGGNTYTGGQKVPVENMFGSGTINAHWRESVLQNELMTGFINGGANPLSQLTVRSLQDLGYVVNALAADPFSLTLSLRADLVTRMAELVDDVLVGRLFAISPQGVITRIR